MLRYVNWQSKVGFCFSFYVQGYGFFKYAPGLIWTSDQNGMFKNAHAVLFVFFFHLCVPLLLAHLVLCSQHSIKQHCLYLSSQCLQRATALGDQQWPLSPSSDRARISLVAVFCCLSLPKALRRYRKLLMGVRHSMSALAQSNGSFFCKWHCAPRYMMEGSTFLLFPWCSF